MSFSFDTKKELMQIPLDKSCCILHELSAITQTAASFAIQGLGRFQLTYQVESTPLARRIFLILRQGFSISPSLHFIQHPRFKTRKTAVLTVEKQDSIKLLTAFNMLVEEEDSYRLARMSPGQMPTKRCCRNAFLRGSFIAAGSISNPEKSYHLEIRTTTDTFKRNLLDVMKKSGLHPKETLRNNSGLVYLKHSDEIISFLAASGAHKALFLMEDIRMQKDIMNQINRSMNCDQYNLDKQLTAAQEQIAAIQLIDQEKGLSALAKPLMDIAHARLLNPEASLSALGALLEPPLGKSGVYHRMEKILALAKNIQQHKEVPHDS